MLIAILNLPICTFFVFAVLMKFSFTVLCGYLFFTYFTHFGGPHLTKMCDTVPLVKSKQYGEKSVIYGQDIN